MTRSEKGRYGPAVYATHNKDICRIICRARHSKPGGKPPIVVMLEVDLGNLKNMYDKDEGRIPPSSDAPWWQEGKYDTGYARHPPWPGANADDGFREFIIPDPRRCKVLSIEPA